MEPPASFLTALSAADRDALVAAGHPRSWETGAPLLRIGDQADTALALQAGLVKVHRMARDGGEVILSVAGPGDLLGEFSALPSAARSADVTALEPVTAVVIARSALRAFLTARPAATLALLELAHRRLRAADARRLEYATAESLPRVAGRLVELAERFGTATAEGGVELALPITQDELASWSATSRESAARALRTLRQLRLIETGRRRIVINDLAALRAHEPRL